MKLECAVAKFNKMKATTAAVVLMYGHLIVSVLNLCITEKRAYKSIWILLFVDGV